jgi:L-alanine-DL-glutamate epimerase-like enolase superfamily enzyme
MIQMLAAELEPIDQKLQTNVTDVSTKASVQDISALDNALTDLRTKIAGELTGGR